MRRALLVAIFVVGAIALSVWAALILTSTRDGGEGTATARDGSQVGIRAAANAPITIVHFWGTWCGPCREELPEFASFKKRYEKAGVAFVTVADDPDFETVDRFLRERGVELDTLLLDPRGAAAREWGVHVYPSTFVVAPDNRVLALYKGTIDWASPLQRREILRLGGIDP